MANKREIKKAIRFACGEIAGQCLFAQSMLETTNYDKWDEIVIDVAMFQEKAIKMVSKKFDKSLKDFDNAKAYRSARKAFAKGVEKEISDFMHENSNKTVEAMNALLPKKK